MSKKIIYCPKCKRKAMEYDGISTMKIEVKCKKCQELVVYEPLTNTTVLKKLPARATASGMRFY